MRLSKWQHVCRVLKVLNMPRPVPLRRRRIVSYKRMRHYSLLRHVTVAEIWFCSSRIAQLIADHSAAVNPGSQSEHMQAADISNDFVPWGSSGERQHGIQQRSGER